MLEAEGSSVGESALCLALFLSSGDIGIDHGLHEGRPTGSAEDPDSLLTSFLSPRAALCESCGGASMRSGVVDESIIGLFKTEVIEHRGPWRNRDAVEFATLTWVDWFNNRRLLEPIGYVPPAEFELAYYQQHNAPAMEAGLN
jgi:hypothetical protein